MQIIRVILASAWVGLSSIAVVGGAYLIMRCPAPEWDHFVRLGRFCCATIRLFGQIDQILEQLDHRPDNDQHQDNQQLD